MSKDKRIAEIDPKRLAIKKDVLMADGTRKNIPVGDLLHYAARQKLERHLAKYPKYSFNGKKERDAKIQKAEQDRKDKEAAEQKQMEAQRDRQITTGIASLPQAENTGSSQDSSGVKPE